MKQPTDSKCRMCCKAEEQITYIVAGCTTFAPSEFSKHVGLQVTDKYCEHIPERVINVNGTTVMWDVPVVTDRTILANQPHVVLHNKEVKTHTDQYSHTDDSNINTKETEKLSKYKDLEIEVCRMWKVRTKIVPVITGALGTSKMGLDQNLQILPGHTSDIRAAEDRTNEH